MGPGVGQRREQVMLQCLRGGDGVLGSPSQCSGYRWGFEQGDAMSSLEFC